MRKYGGNEERVIQSCFRSNVKIGSEYAARYIAWVIDQSEDISISSSPEPTLVHPAYKAFVALEELALPWLLKRLSEPGERGCGWELMAADTILDKLKIEAKVPETMRGRVMELKGFYRKAIKRFMNSRKEFYKAAKYRKCACGKNGEWISDGISRTGYYCRKCSDEALENA
jgi:hypothetical protein